MRTRSRCQRHVGPQQGLCQRMSTLHWTKYITHTTLYKMKHTVCEQVLAVILVRQQHMPCCSFQNGSQEKSERRRAKLPLSLISLLLLSVISCHCSVLLMSDPERQFIGLLSDTRCMSVQRKNSVHLWSQAIILLILGLGLIGMEHLWVLYFKIKKERQSFCPIYLHMNLPENKIWVV